MEVQNSRNVVTSEMVARALEDALPMLACGLPSDVRAAVECARKEETCPTGKLALDLLSYNDTLARKAHTPLCQDTGYVWVCLEIGPQTQVTGDVFSQVNDVVSRVYSSCFLRKSLLQDAFSSRVNTTDNTPAFCEIYVNDALATSQLHIMLKGGGSDNASRVIMLPPAAGKEGIINEVLACVQEKGPNACPPLTLGIGIGATFDKVGGLAKRALMRLHGQRSEDAFCADLEVELLRRINDLSIGAGSLGGACTALDVHVVSAPCHIAALPLAINLGCCALRRVTVDVCAGDKFTLEGAPAAVVSCVEGAPAGSGRGGLSDAVGVAECADDAAVLSGTSANGEGVHAKCDTSDVGAAKGSLAADDEALDYAALSPICVTLPLSQEQRASLKAGDFCLLSGPAFILRDAGHARLCADLATTGELPYDLEGGLIFYAGPSPHNPQLSLPFGAIGPTTSSRMDAYAPQLYDAGVVATLGKGARSKAVAQACARNTAVYFTTVGGVASALSHCVVASELLAYEDLGCEALQRIILKDFPAVVSIDSAGLLLS